MSDPMRLGALLEFVLGDGGSQDSGTEPRSRQPPGCVGHPEPIHPQHHRQCVLADRQERACLAGACRYADPHAEPNFKIDGCIGYLGQRRLRHGACEVIYRRCPRFVVWWARERERIQQRKRDARGRGGPRESPSWET